MEHRITRGERARAEIVSAARGLLVEVGADAFSLREVARRTGYAPSALYNHFADKDSLVLAVAVSSLEQLQNALHAVVDEELSAYDALRALGRAYVEFAAEHEAEYRVIFDCLTNPPAPWKHYVAMADPFTLIVAAVARGVERGELALPANVSADEIAYGLWCLSHGHARLRATHLAHVTAEYDRLYDVAVDALLAGVTTDGSPS